MALFIFVALNAKDGSMVPWTFDTGTEYAKARDMARDAGRLVHDCGADYITDADEFAHWLKQTKAKKRAPQFTRGGTLSRIAECRLADHAGDLQRDDGDPEENKAHRMRAVSNALEDAARECGIELGAPENYADALDGLHAYADETYPPTYAEDADGHAIEPDRMCATCSQYAQTDDDGNCEDCATQRAPDGDA
jgi:hypothetical protein